MGIAASNIILNLGSASRRADQAEITSQFGRKASRTLHTLDNGRIGKNQRQDFLQTKLYIRKRLKHVPSSFIIQITSHSARPDIVTLTTISCQ